MKIIIQIKTFKLDTGEDLLMFLKKKKIQYKKLFTH